MGIKFFAHDISRMQNLKQLAFHEHRERLDEPLKSYKYFVTLARIFIQQF